MNAGERDQLSKFIWISFILDMTFCKKTHHANLGNNTIMAKQFLELVWLMMGYPSRFRHNRKGLLI